MKTKLSITKFYRNLTSPLYFSSEQQILFIYLLAHETGTSFQTCPFTRMLALILVLLIHQTTLNLVESRNFTFTSFDTTSCENASDLICWGSVNAGNGSLNITSGQSQIENGTTEVGRVLFRYPIPIWPVSFSTTFTIRVMSNSTVSGDGMAFVIAQDNKPSPPDSYGSFIGIMDPSSEGGVLRQLAVAFDTYKNPREIDGNHIAIITTRVEHPIAVKSLNDIGINLKIGRNITIKIEYDGYEKLLHIYASYSGEALVNVLSHKIILRDTVPQQAYVGFTGSTGHLPEVHQVLDWNFTLYELPKKSLGDEGNKVKMVMEIVMPIIAVLLVGVVVVIFVVHRRRRRRFGRRNDMELLTKNAANAPTYFSYRQLSKATGKFSKENLLGTGGFGSVYKGVLSDTGFAVKKIHATSNQGEREFLAEICTIGRLRHKNLVQLQGWCHDKEQLLLVYDYMPNGSLDRYFGKDILDWETRYKILSGVASVLLYLHEECGTPVVHRDVKPNNIMLDSEFNPHLGDFGLARLLKNNDFVSTMVAGTIGYLAPEVSYTGRATPESDVYSFGMVVLELVCGRRSKVMEEFNLLEYVWNLYEKGSLVSCVDQMLEGEFDDEQVKRSLLVGLACLHPDQMLRPKMRKVVQIFLNLEEPLMKLPDARPTELCLSLSSSSYSTTSTTTTTTTTDFGSVTIPVSGSLGHFPDKTTIQYYDC